MKGSGKIAKNKAKEFIRAKTTNTKENSKITKNTVLEYIKTQKEKFMKDNGKMTKSKVRENSKNKESLKWRGSGREAL